MAEFHIAFIWVSSLALPLLSRLQRLPENWRRRLRLLINYFQRNFYQQLLFFILPIYYFSASWGTGNMVFVLLVAASALLATMDIIYDRYLSRRWLVLAMFFAFNLFACINVMLPIVWNFKNSFALRLSALLALAGFASFCLTLREVSGRDRLLLVLAAALLLAGVSEVGRPLIPPAPLRLTASRFYLDFDPESTQAQPPLTHLPAGGPYKIYALTAISAPLGLKDRVGHRWYLNGRLVHASPFFTVQGGRKTGFRFWTFRTLKNILPDSTLLIELRTEAGQLIGRARLH
ncbi:MAG: DUF5924 family protein [Candidatus Aminicenantes bacterium]|nr:DUF5924 family protein [Candidatus Aminicenantes bacterium]